MSNFLHKNMNNSSVILNSCYVDIIDASEFEVAVSRGDFFSVSVGGLIGRWQILKKIDTRYCDFKLTGMNTVLIIKLPKQEKFDILYKNTHVFADDHRHFGISERSYPAVQDTRSRFQNKIVPHGLSCNPSLIVHLAQFLRFKCMQYILYEPFYRHFGSNIPNNGEILLRMRCPRPCLVHVYSWLCVHG